MYNHPYGYPDFQQQQQQPPPQQPPLQQLGHPQRPVSQPHPPTQPPPPAHFSSPHHHRIAVANGGAAAGVVVVAAAPTTNPSNTGHSTSNTTTTTDPQMLGGVGRGRGQLFGSGPRSSHHHHNNGSGAVVVAQPSSSTAAASGVAVTPKHNPFDKPLLHVSRFGGPAAPFHHHHPQQHQHPHPAMGFYAQQQQQQAAAFGVHPKHPHHLQQPQPYQRAPNAFAGPSNTVQFGGGGADTKEDRARAQSERARNPGGALQQPHWGALQPFAKCFYRPTAQAMSRSAAEIDAFRAALEITVVAGQAVPQPMQTFEEAGFPAALVAEMRGTLGFQAPTAIQAQGWPLALSGRDLVGIAQTGSGKTLAYMLPALVHIQAQVAAERAATAAAAGGASTTDGECGDGWGVLA